MTDNQAATGPAAEVQTPPPESAPTKTENSEYRLREWARLVIEFLTLVAVVFYGFVAYCQWSAMIAANKQTKTALHVTERAYVTVNSPIFETTSKFISFNLSNTGHIPSGNIQAIIHESTINSTISNKFSPEFDTPAETSWKKHILSPLPPGKDLITMKIPVPAFSESKFTPEGVYQIILVAGRIAYYDGFPDDPQQEWPFCYQTSYHMTLKQIFLIPCDAARWISGMEKHDGYPHNEQID